MSRSFPTHRMKQERDGRGTRAPDPGQQRLKPWKADPPLREELRVLAFGCYQAFMGSGGRLISVLVIPITATDCWIASYWLQKRV